MYECEKQKIICDYECQLNQLNNLFENIESDNNKKVENENELINKNEEEEKQNN